METHINEADFGLDKPDNHKNSSDFYNTEYQLELNEIEEDKSTSWVIENDSYYELFNRNDLFEGTYELKKKFILENWSDFDDAIFYSAKDFYEEYGVVPNMVVMNEYTYEQICWLISISLKRKHIKYEEREVEIGKFEYTHYTLEVEIIENKELKNKEFYIIYDLDFDEDDDDDDEEPDLPIDVPDQPEEVMEVCVIE